MVVLVHITITNMVPSTWLLLIASIVSLADLAILLAFQLTSFESLNLSCHMYYGLYQLFIGY